MNLRSRRLLASVLVSTAPVVALVACAGSAPPTPAQPCVTSAAPIASTPIVASAAPSSSAPTPAEAVRFVDDAEAELARLSIAEQRAAWVKETNITADTDAILQAASEETMAFRVHVSHAATRFDGVPLPAETARKLMLLKTRITVPSPSDAHARSELAAIDVSLESTYGAGKYCATAADSPAIKWHLAHDESAKKKAHPKDEKVCLDLDTLDAMLGATRDEAVLRDAWKGWHAIAKPMRPKYQRFVELANEGAREIGYPDLGALWRAGYDMTPAEFEADTERLWKQVKPLYDELHCFARKRLRKVYGKELVPDHGAIPAHLLGGMWAQDWSTIYDTFEPYKGEGSLDVTRALKAKKIDEQGMVRLGERFYTRLGFDPLPKTFWERSLFRRPDDREVECHASAWDVVFHDDLRIKMCVQTTEQDLLVIHHELGHDYYFHSYYTLPFLFQDGANDGFHEAIGDTMALSVTPGYLKSIGLLDALPKTSKGQLNVQMKRALEKIAFLPFGKLVDQWRWDVFSGKTPPEKYNERWWQLRREYQGVAPPEARSEADFDPGAKNHVAAQVSYTRYFLAFIYQFQFHRALCKVAGFKGPLSECSIDGSTAAGDKLRAMLALGASVPWPKALEALSGETQADATAILEYFAPLREFLAKENAGETCGW